MSIKITEDIEIYGYVCRGTVLIKAPNPAKSITLEVSGYYVNPDGADVSFPTRTIVYSLNADNKMEAPTISAPVPPPVFADFFTDGGAHYRLSFRMLTSSFTPGRVIPPATPPSVVSAHYTAKFWIIVEERKWAHTPEKGFHLVWAPAKTNSSPSKKIKVNLNRQP